MTTEFYGWPEAFPDQIIRLTVLRAWSNSGNLIESFDELDSMQFRNVTSDYVDLLCLVQTSSDSGQHEYVLIRSHVYYIVDATNGSLSPNEVSVHKVSNANLTETLAREQLELEGYWKMIIATRRAM